jgi:16S rRNA (cytosine1402-N4)-methyltransferase
VAFITFQTEQGMEEALSWDGCEFGGRRIHISVATKGTLNAKWGIKPTYQAAGTHTPAMLEECIRELTTQDPNGVYVDGTFGRGGHTRGLLQKIPATAQLHAFDLDPEAIVVGKELEAEDSRFTIHHRPFGELAAVLGARGLQPSGLLLDLGISSPQFDDAHRGFRPEQVCRVPLLFTTTLSR